MENRKKRLGDRKDGTLMRELDSLHFITGVIYPNRCDNEAYISERVDLTPIKAYIDKKNAEETEFAYTYFHLVLTALVKAITLRLDKYRAEPARDAAKLAELRPQEQRYWRLVAERKGQVDARMQELRWLLEELRVSFFAQELRTPQPVSVKRLDKLWAQVNS